ncbi:MAG: hypothetical protein JXB49_12350 [Bacteroidales bacterium]|nr:hypothetical protein [Bacteroidales bacterium]
MELLSFILEVLLFIYLIVIVRIYKVRIPVVLVLFFICLLSSNIFTVIEDYILYNLFNILEHILFTLSCFFLMVYVFTLKESLMND